jgi:N-acyl-L-homoserine lactone synthetase
MSIIYQSGPVPAQYRPRGSAGLSHETRLSHGTKQSDVVVPVETRVFDDCPKAAYYVGVIAVPGAVCDAGLQEAAARLRYEVYVREKGLMHPDADTQATGLEKDSNDDRSLQIVTLKNRGLHQSPDLVGHIRLVVKRHEGDLLPIEQLFPEAFSQGAAAINSGEASRFIARTTGKGEQHQVARSLIRALAVNAATQYEQPSYAVADRYLLGMFNGDGVKYEPLAEPRVLDEYSTPSYNLPNTPIRLDAHQVLSGMTSPNAPPDIQNMYRGIFSQQGVGYFDASMAAICNLTRGV